jgi:hypothetical protein
MTRLVTLTILVLYVAACWGTMPSQCFTPKFALECQRVQLNAIKDWRTITWSTVDSVRRI